MLDDLLEPGLAIAFCGTAAGLRSAALAPVLRRPWHQFWKVLAQVGLTPRQLTPHEYGLLPRFGIGLTDVVKGETGSDSGNHISVARQQLVTKDRPIPGSNTRLLQELAVQTVILNNGVTMPIAGYGVFQIPDSQECTRCVVDAIHAGYRLIDTAASYLNEAAVGQGIKDAGIPREQSWA